MINMSPTKKTRAKGVKLPSWFIDRVREIADGRKKSWGESLTDLGKLLSQEAGKQPAWGHGEVSRFLDEKVTTAPMAEAFASLFRIPRPFYNPRTFEEATDMEQVARRHDGARPNPDQSSRMGAFDHAARLADVEIEGHTHGVASKDERTPGSRRAGRAARSRS